MIPTGSELIDSLLNGGYEKGIITTIYGPSGSGKTCLCLISATEIAKNKKVIYVDTEGGFSVTRLKQLTGEHKKILSNFLFFKPTNFEEQVAAFESIKKIANGEIGLIVIDSIAMLYRLELGKSEEVYEVNKQLGNQLGILTEIARKKNIPILVSNQIYSNFEDKSKVNMVGGDLLKYSSKCLIELQNNQDQSRTAILRKHRFLKESSVKFKIIEKGIEKNL
ncbi:DNA repair and recombination protein RadB [Candidatus Woesearchaeota archaeon]|nr:DNA repair and recombination protein RadB [Candidatus Woesearchaeota archaeon]